MRSDWAEQPPDQYRSEVTYPLEYESHHDAVSQSRKTWGYDLRGERCFYQHEFTLSEERFDVDEFPIRVDVFWERVTAWRMKNGQWLRLRRWSDSLDSCPKRYVTDPAEIVSEAHLQTMAT
ncbi:hypothetical protein [Methyloterricola oryzae]|uniref:hypothetical protein n=1 Tax=Methyloterricola oryzae TaxID=1495050 RepID=UPI0005EAF7D2|nr:hypothetical protein [Methyloterricola oryzae]